MDNVLDKLDPEKDGTSLKRFLTLRGEELNATYPFIFETLCLSLVFLLNKKLPNLSSKKFLVDLVGHPSLLTPVAFVKGFLASFGGTVQANFIKYGWRETVAEILKENYRGVERKALWEWMVREFPSQFSGQYPLTEQARTVALKNFPTKQDREDAWARENVPKLAPKLLKKLMELGTESLLPSVLWHIIAEYAVSWLEVE